MQPFDFTNQGLPRLFTFTLSVPTNTRHFFVLHLVLYSTNVSFFFYIRVDDSRSVVYSQSQIESLKFNIKYVSKQKYKYNIRCNKLRYRQAKSKPNLGVMRIQNELTFSVATVLRDRKLGA